MLVGPKGRCGSCRPGRKEDVQGSTSWIGHERGASSLELAYRSDIGRTQALQDLCNRSQHRRQPPPKCPLSPKPLSSEVLTLDFRYTSNQSESLNETRNPKILGLRERHANVGPIKLQLESETPGSSWNCTLTKPMKTVWRPVGILCNPRCRLSSLQQNGPKDSGDGGKAGPIPSRRESLHGVPAHRPTSCGDHQGGPQHSTSSDDAHRPARDLYALHASASSITASVPDVSRDVLSRRIPPLRVCERSHGSYAMRSRASLV